MAERRMFSKNVIESDPFMDMPAEAQMLYIHLNMASDDDGFCDNPRAIMRQCGASNDSMKLLIAKKFVLTFDKNDGFVAVIKHWRINNYIRKDNYRETKYKEFMRDLYYDENRSYSLNPGDSHTPCIPSSVTQPSQECVQPVYEPSTNRTRDVHDPLTQDRLGKDSIEEVSIGKDNTIPTTSTVVQDAKPEEKPSLTKNDVNFIVGAWNEIPELTNILCLDSKSKPGRLLLELSETYSPFRIVEGINKVKASDFLRGVNESGWKISFEWFLDRNNFEKVLSGQYDNRQQKKSKAHEYAPDAFDPGAINNIKI